MPLLLSVALFRPLVPIDDYHTTQRTLHRNGVRRSTHLVDAAHKPQLFLVNLPHLLQLHHLLLCLHKEILLQRLRLSNGNGRWAMGNEQCPIGK